MRVYDFAFQCRSIVLQKGFWVEFCDSEYEDCGTHPANNAPPGNHFWLSCLVLFCFAKFVRSCSVLQFSEPVCVLADSKATLRYFCC